MGFRRLVIWPTGHLIGCRHERIKASPSDRPGSRQASRAGSHDHNMLRYRRGQQPSWNGRQWRIWQAHGPRASESVSCRPLLEGRVSGRPRWPPLTPEIGLLRDGP